MPMSGHYRGSFQMLSEKCPSCATKDAEIAALRTERDALREDAERFRFC
jgi:hypothetical protein